MNSRNELNFFSDELLLYDNGTLRPSTEDHHHSNEKAAKSSGFLRNRPIQQDLINAGSPINAGGSDLLYE